LLTGLAAGGGCESGCEGGAIPRKGFVTAGCAGGGALSTDDAPAPDAPAAEKGVSEGHTALQQAYVAGYSGVEILRTREMGTHVSAATANKAPINQFAHRDHLISAADRIVVTPNNDTLYSIAFLDLEEEPLVLHVPAFGKRYFVVPFLSAYHENFASIGQRTHAADGEQLFTAPEGGDFLIAGPDYDGEAPDGMEVVRSPTNDVWVIMRPVVNGEKDLPKVLALQRPTPLTPLSNWGDPNWSPPTDVLLGSVAHEGTLGKPLEGPLFFEALSEVVKRNPPQGVEPALANALARLPKDAGAEATTEASQAAVAQIRGELATLGEIKNGWMVLSGDQGLYHGDVLRRAAYAYAYVGLGVINAAEAVYPPGAGGW